MECRSHPQIAERFGLRGMPAAGTFGLWVLFTATTGIVRGLSTALGEEIGWRGFLVPELAKQMSFARLSFLSGIVWAAWHSPLLLFADYNAGTNRAYAMGCFTVMIVSTSFAFAWLRLKSRSLWPAALLHASHNLFIQTVFDNLMRNTGNAAGNLVGCPLVLDRNDLAAHQVMSRETWASRAAYWP